MDIDQLIEWFINKIEVSKVLDGIINSDEIRIRLHSNIKKIVEGMDYSDETYYIATWDAEQGNLILSSKVKENEYGRVLIHEMLHALTTEYFEDKSNRVGFQRGGYDGTVDSKGNKLIASFGGVGLDEGMTEYLACLINNEKSNVYYGEQRTVQLLELFGGKENLINDYIYGTDRTKQFLDTEFEKGAYNKIFQIRDKITTENRRIHNLSQMIKKYGDSDNTYQIQIEEATKENDKRINEINDILINMANIKLERTDDVKDKLNFLIDLKTKGKNDTGNSISIDDLSKKELKKIIENIFEIDEEEFKKYEEILNEISRIGMEKDSASSKISVSRSDDTPPVVECITNISKGESAENVQKMTTEISRKVREKDALDGHGDGGNL